jgi:hypothetical protein
VVATAGGSQSFAPEMTGRASQRVALEKAMRLALDRLEVDPAFVRDLLGDRDDVAIVDHPGTRPLAQAPRGRRGTWRLRPGSSSSRPADAMRSRATGSAGPCPEQLPTLLRRGRG